MLVELSKIYSFAEFRGYCMDKQMALKFVFCEGYCLFLTYCDVTILDGCLLK